MRSGRLIAAFALAAACGAAGAQPAPTASYPTRPIRMIVPFPPGGTVDTVARVVTAPMSDELGQPLVIDNRAGGSGSIGSAFVSKAPADGYTLLLTASIIVGTPMLLTGIPYDVQKDFAPISNLGSVPLLLVVNPGLPAASFAEFVALARAQPGKLAFATSGIGSAGHLATEMIKFNGKLDMVIAAYKGTAPALVDVVSGQVAAMVDALPSSYAQVKAGKLRALAVTSPKRLAFLPDLATVAESGVPGFEGFDLVSWYGLWGPPGLPKAITDRLSAAAARAIHSKLAAERLAGQSFVPVGSSAEAFAAYIAAETTKYRNLIDGAKIKRVSE